MQKIAVDSSYMKKNEMITFISKQNIEILKMIPKKLVLLEKIILKNI